MCLAKRFEIPEQLSLDLVPTDAEKSYKDGYNTGVNWDASWMPGGPWYYESKNPNQKNHTKRQYDVWHEGFKKGFAIRMQNSHYAEWYNEHKNKPSSYGYGLHRYYRPEVLNEEML